MEFKDTFLPTAEKLETWLELQEGGPITDLIEHSLLAPLNEFLSRPGKSLRGKLVELGFQLVNRESEGKKCLAAAAQVLETIHAASLVVDDIQDNSEWRRGQPTLHRTHGIAVALNSANWLYFWPFEKIQSWKIGAEEKARLNSACNRALIKAHSGQALDVGTPIHKLEKPRIYSVCLASLELKTGALTALALELGAILAGATESQIQSLSRFGLEFGIALQMFDDLGNVGQKNPPDSKRFEDLKLGRPSWIWATASQILSDKEFEEFLELVAILPEERELSAYFNNVKWVQESKAGASEYLDRAVSKLTKESWSQTALNDLCALVDQLKKAYD
ncbi:MAG: hypothetical protein EB078_07300 [Proteobacteria bacterium]|nr:hypothetical protein [Pseudomonadota bacterium]NDC24891.1 hypothetical protein [Pseudomonadota bacterium]NDD04695.1 hypothetical protein [Pseudomonadota bacterium]